MFTLHSTHITQVNTHVMSLIDLDLSDIRDDFFHKSWYFRVKNFGAICLLENYLSEQFVPGTSLEATSFLV